MKQLRASCFMLHAKKGFTVVELLVSIAILGIMFSFVLANFRAGQKSGQLDIVLKQTIDGITNVRNMSLGGQIMADGTFPVGGYGIHFDLTNPDQFSAFAKTATGNQPLLNAITKFDQVTFVQFCGSIQDNVSSLPCQSPGWENINNSLEIIFNLPNEISAVPPTGAAGNFKYVGGVIQHAKTGQRSYFYVSLISGMVSGNILP